MDPYLIRKPYIGCLLLFAIPIMVGEGLKQEYHAKHRLPKRFQYL